MAYAMATVTVGIPCIGLEPRWSDRPTMETHRKVTLGDLTSVSPLLIIPGNCREPAPPRVCAQGASGFMSLKLPSAPQSVGPQQPCKHPRVQIVSRDEDAEFVECKECGEIFDSSEFKDMNIEERTSEEF